MNTQLNNLLNVISLNSSKATGLNITSTTGQPKKSFTAAELWNIQRRRKTRNLFCLQLG